MTTMRKIDAGLTLAPDFQVIPGDVGAGGEKYTLRVCGNGHVGAVAVADHPADHPSCPECRVAELERQLARWVTRLDEESALANRILRVSGDRIELAMFCEVLDTLRRLRAAVATSAQPECPGCDRQGREIKQQPDGSLVCARCGRVVIAAETTTTPAQHLIERAHQ